jgi:pimeloyl-ACP methyl ester carboxylesterase
MNHAPTPFTLHVPDEAIADLRERLARTRLPDPAPGDPWAYGTDIGYLHELLEYWRDHFDWRAQESLLNALPQYRVTIADADIHFLHVPGRGAPGAPAPMPLLLSHGWPGSVFEFLDIVPQLTDPARFGGDPADAFTVVVPSLPGYGLSHVPGRRYPLEVIADRFATLMTDVLGYPRFGAQGGDWGSFITTRLAIAHADKLAGIHLNMMPVRRDAQRTNPSPDEARYLQEVKVFLKEETGYQWIQGTRPQTLAVGLTDSPAGLAAWIVEKFHRWTDCGGRIESAVDRDRMLANISLYWFTGAIAASFWPYYVRMHSVWPVPEDGSIRVPTGYCEFPHEILKPPRSLAERSFADIRRWSVMPEGGHFAALEQPQALAQEIREFFRPLRTGT